LPAVLLATAGWQAYIEQGYVAWRLDDWRSWLLAASVGALILGAAALLAIRRRADTRLPGTLAIGGLFFMLAAPTAWALSTVLVRPNVAAPFANIEALANTAADASAQGSSAAARASARKLIRFLKAQRGTERFLLAVPNAAQAAPIIVRTGEPVMAMGGYLGRDPILAVGDLERMVNDGELRFVMLGGFSLVPPTTRRERALGEWIRTHGTPVDPSLWRETGPAPEASLDRLPRPGPAAQLYDLRGGKG